jgi:transcriptional regulator with XRE-family HTH domain
MRGHQLAERRTTAGVTQAELADALGVSRARIPKIEHGEISGRCTRPRLARSCLTEGCVGAAPVQQGGGIPAARLDVVYAAND